MKDRPIDLSMSSFAFHLNEVRGLLGYVNKGGDVMKMVTCIIRGTCLGRIVKELEKINVRSMTISAVKGIGEQVTLNKQYTIHNMIQIIVPNEKVDEVNNVILHFTRTGMAGDGIIAVSPIDYMIKIKSKERLE